MSLVGECKLKKNFSTWAIFSIINNTKLQDKEVIGWRLVGGKKVTIKLKIRVIRKFRNEMAVVAYNEQMTSELDAVLSGMDKLNFYLPEDMVLFQSEVKAIYKNEIVVSLPKMIAQIDRRKFLRLIVPADLNVTINFAKKNNASNGMAQKFKKSCFDLSAGGLSFIVSRMECKYFNVHDLMKIKLEFDELSLIAAGQIVSILEVSPEDNVDLHYKGWKICMKFINLKESEQKNINNFVFKNINTQINAL